MPRVYVYYRLMRRLILLVSQKLIKALNDQYNYELLSAHYYLAMAAYCTEEDLDGCANFFMQQAAEERFHADKFYDYITEVDGRVLITAIDAPQNNFKSLCDVFKMALEHEQSVTKRVYGLMDIANDEREHATKNFLNWFVEEQVEEEATMKEIIKRIERVGDEGHGIFMLDKELGERVFSAPSAE